MRKGPTTREVIKACRLYHAGKAKSTPVALSTGTGYSERAVLRKMQRLVDKGVLEMGISVRTAWVAGEQEYEPTISNSDELPKPIKKRRKPRYS